jgi:cell wall-associated NlpC family hydrolase
MAYEPAVVRRIKGTAGYTETTNPSLYQQLYGQQAPQDQDPIEVLRQQMEQDKVARFTPRGPSVSSGLKAIDASPALTTKIIPGAISSPYQTQLNNTALAGSKSADFAEDQKARREAAAAAAAAANKGGGGGAGFDVPTGSDIGSRIVAAAMKELGIPYSWGGGGAGGPSKGIEQGRNTVGFDCSGLVQYAYAKVGLKMPRVSYGQLQMGSRAALKNLRPGDLVGFGNGHHIGIYIGGGKFIESPHTGAQVRISSLSGRSDAWGVKVYH